ncbi:kinase-like protein [Lanmaoa asiatica]|nr:kinase-like protein [Lanmaoa asiatica]
MADSNLVVAPYGPYPAHLSKHPDIPVAASPTPSTSLHILSENHRGSISTTRTSSTECSIQDIDEPLIPLPRLTSRPRASYKLADFIIQRTLGTGSFGRVHLVRSKHNLRFYAIKVLSKDKIVKTKQEAIQHPFIINLWGAFQDDSNLYMVMDYVPGGELFTLLRRSNRFPDPVAKFYAAEVALALRHLHSLDIIYRDLKPENILLNHDGHIKIADFGFSKRCSSVTWTLCGTPDYLAPEIVGQQRYNKSVDWYALGVLIFEMLSGLPPYHHPDQNNVSLYEKISRGPTFIRWPPFKANATDLILKLMERDPSRRSIGGKLMNREISAPYLPKISGEGDASAFENYPEDNASAMYGRPAPDPWGSSFPNFEYTAVHGTS